MEWCRFLTEFEAIHSDFVENTFKRVAYMTRLGHIGFREAIEMCHWDQRHFIAAIDELVAEQNRATRGLPNGDD